MMSDVQADRRIEAFARRFGAPHLDFARHSALAPALTPDLLYRLWANFPTDIYGAQLNIPWVVVADLLLSGLCREVGNELFEMDAAIQRALTNQLRSEARFVSTLC